MPGGYYCSKEGTKVLYGLKILDAPKPLAELIDEINYATPKQVFFFDNSFAFDNKTIPANSTDNRSCATAIPIHLDPARAVPEIVAHELMHSWIEFYCGLEDGREYVDQSNRTVSMVVSFVQSLVLDCTVLWQLRKRGGFDHGVFRHDIMAGARLNVAPLKRGMMHGTPLGQLVAAYALAVPKAFPNLYGLSAWDRKELEGLWRALRKCEPSIERTADKIATALSEHGYESESGIRASVDKSLSASFEFLCHPFDPEKDMVPRIVRLVLADKMPEFMSGLPVDIKHEALRDSIRSRQHILSAAYTPGKKVIVNFAPAGSRFSHRMLPRIARPSGEGPTHMFCYEPGMTEQEEASLRPPLSHLPFPYPDIYSQTYTASLGQVTQFDRPIGKEHRMFYMPDVGRFLAKDMIRRPLQNPYVYSVNNPGSFVDPLGLSECKVDCNSAPDKDFSSMPTGGGELSPEAHLKFQQLIDKYTTLIDWGEVSPCAAFARLFGRLYEGTGQDMDWTTVYAIYYFTDYKYTINDLFKGTPGMGQTTPWTNAWGRPDWLSSHQNQGPTQGYIQSPRDTDEGGRHDHFLSNLWAGIQGGAAGDLAARIAGRIETSPTDRRVNALGLDLASTFKRKQLDVFPKGVGSKMTGEEISKWIYDNLCDESKKKGCKTATSGPLTNEKAKKLMDSLDALIKTHGQNWQSLPWDRSQPGLPSPIR